ncbi:MAG: hypothetical protein M0Z85_01685, partial [Gammaproteobacteria bacterium]|nr:hypothetical protein [Gammaproteobacteria bacterium]
MRKDIEVCAGVPSNRHSTTVITSQQLLQRIDRRIFRGALLFQAVRDMAIAPDPEINDNQPRRRMAGVYNRYRRSVANWISAILRTAGLWEGGVSERESIDAIRRTMTDDGDPATMTPLVWAASLLTADDRGDLPGIAAGLNMVDGSPPVRAACRLVPMMTDSAVRAPSAPLPRAYVLSAIVPAGSHPSLGSGVLKE